MNNSHVKTITCWPGGRYAALTDYGYVKICAAEFTGTLGEAGANGWAIGWVGKQAYYVCPKHTKTVNDGVPLYD